MPKKPGSARQQNLGDDAQESTDWRLRRVKNRAEELASYAPDYLSRIGEIEKKEGKWAQEESVGSRDSGCRTVPQLCQRYGINEQRVNRLTELGISVKMVEGAIRQNSYVKHEKVVAHRWHSIATAWLLLPERVYRWERIDNVLGRLETFAVNLSKRDESPGRIALPKNASVFWRNSADEDEGLRIGVSGDRRDSYVANRSIAICEYVLRGGILFDDGILGIGDGLAKVKRDIFLYQYMSAIASSLKEDRHMGFSIIREGRPFFDKLWGTLERSGESFAEGISGRLESRENSARIDFITSERVVSRLAEIEGRLSPMETISNKDIMANDSYKGVAFHYFKNLALFRDGTLLDGNTLALFDTLGGTHTGQLLYYRTFTEKPGLMLSKPVRENAAKIAEMPYNFFGTADSLGRIPIELLDSKVINYIKEIGSERAIHYVANYTYKAGEKRGGDEVYEALPHMLSDKIFGTAQFVRSLPVRWARAYFHELSDSDALDFMASPQVVGIIENNRLLAGKRADPDFGDNYFAALATTRDLRLTQHGYTESILGLGDIAYPLLNALKATKNVDVLLDGRILGFVERLGNASEGLASRYLNALTTKNLKDLTSTEFLGYFTDRVHLLAPVLDILGKRHDSETRNEHSGMQGHVSSALMHLLSLSKKMPKEFEEARSRIADLVKYESTLRLLGYDAAAETEFLVRKGDRAYMSRAAANVANVVSSIEDARRDIEVPFPLHLMRPIAERYRELVNDRRWERAYRDMDRAIATSGIFKRFEYLLSAVSEFKRSGINPSELVDAIDNCASLLLLDRSLPGDIRKNIYSNIADIGRQRRVGERRLRQAYGEVFDYMDRHTGLAKQNGTDSPLVSQRDKILSSLSTCYMFGKEPNSKTVKQEKQILARGGSVAVKREYEEHLVDELGRAANAARFAKFMEHTAVHSAILKAIIGREVRDKDIPIELKNAVEGYLTVDHNKSLLLKLIRAYALGGASAANDWALELEGNKRATKAMVSRGTNIGELNKFEVTFDAVKPMDFIEKNRIRIAQIYSEIMSLVRQAGYNSLKQLGVEESGDATKDATAIYNSFAKLSEKTKFTRDQMLILEDIRDHLNSIKTSSGQLYVADGNARIRFFITPDPLKKMQLGVGFNSCLDIRRGAFSYGAVSRAIDANNLVMFASIEGEEAIMGRVSLVETDKGLLVNSHFYENTVYDLSGKENGWISALIALSNKSNRPVLLPKRFIETVKPTKYALEKHGFRLEEAVDLKIDMAVCADVYSDLYDGPARLRKEGIAIAVDAYVIGPDASRLRR